MKTTGMVRRVDSLGRIVIPKEIRKVLKIKENEQVEINVSGDEIILNRYSELDDKDIFLKRMGRTEDERWYDKVSFADTNVLIIEWTHGGNENLRGVDVPVLLNSTPEETREHRRLRARDGKTDSAFTTMVLEIEQEELDRVGKQAKIIMAKSGDFTDPATF